MKKLEKENLLNHLNVALCGALLAGDVIGSLMFFRKGLGLTASDGRVRNGVA
jgi:hypothetical protein